MRKALPYLGAALSVLAITMATPSQAQNPFKDVDQNHWAYAAIADLAEKKVLEGYPDGFFRGKRTLTRYEFAVALKRALDRFLELAKIEGVPGPPGPAGANGSAGADGAPGRDGSSGMTAEEVEQLRALIKEFRAELASLGANTREANNRLDALAKDVAEIKERIQGLPKISGNFWVGARTDHSRFRFVDQSGAARGSSPTHFGRGDVVHNFTLGLEANLPGDTKFTGQLTTTNYFAYRGAGLGNVAASSLNIGGVPAYTQDFIPYQAQVDIPIKDLGSNTVLTLGRYKHHLTALTYMRPDGDLYFNIPQYDDGNYVQDGLRLSTKFGSATTSAWVASFATPVLTSGGVINRPMVGSGPIFVGGGANFLGGAKPIGMDPLTSSVSANQTAGVKIGIPLASYGDLGVSATMFSTNANNANVSTPFNNVVVYSANLNLKDWGRFSLSAEAAKSVTQRSFDTGDGQSNEDNNAYVLHAGYDAGSLKVKAGYKYFDLVGRLPCKRDNTDRAHHPRSAWRRRSVPRLAKSPAR